MKTIFYRVCGVSAALLLSACAVDTPVESPTQYSECRAREAAQLVGTRGLNDAQIKEMTGANVVRRLHPNEATTKDMRPNRINIIIDVPTKQVMRAYCG